MADDKEAAESHQRTDGVESDHDPKPENTDPKDYKNVPGNQT